MFPMDRKPQAVCVEYDVRGERVRRTFSNEYAARRFWILKDRAGKRPAVVAPTSNSKRA
jgi:hypothetical protein